MSQKKSTPTKIGEIQKGCNRCNQLHRDGRCPNCGCPEYRIISFEPAGKERRQATLFPLE